MNIVAKKNVKTFFEISVTLEKSFHKIFSGKKLSRFVKFTGIQTVMPLYFFTIWAYDSFKAGLVKFLNTALDQLNLQGLFRSAKTNSVVDQILYK